MDSLINRYIARPFSIFFPKIIFIIIAVALCVSAILCFFYLINDHETIKNWYLGLNDCFYRHEYWTRDFFTSAVKLKGNKFALAGIVFSIAGLVYSFLNIKRYWILKPALKDGTRAKYNSSWYVIIIIMAIGLWCWGNAHIDSSYDELFSAVNCADLPLFQTMSYYMLVNNHILFNFLNNLLFSWYGDLLQTSRFISLIAYAGILCCVFCWFSKMMRNKWHAFLAVIPVSLQFTTWAFASQGRGYELQAFATWLAFISIFNYVQKNGKTSLRANGFYCFVGFAIVPTFFYYYLSQLLFVLLFMVYNKRIDLKFIKYQLFCGVVVFLFYLPVICYSGSGSFSGNYALSAMAKDIGSYIPMLFSNLKYDINFVSSFLLRENHPVNYMLFLFPLVLFFSKKKQNLLYGLYYTLFWLSFIAIAIYMKSHPAIRTIILHFNFSLVIIIYTIYTCLEYVISKIAIIKKQDTFKTAAFTIIIALFSLHLYRRDADPEHISDMYGYPINYLYSVHSKVIDNIPAGNSIAFSNESFYYYYFCRKRHLNVSRCPKGNEDYYVIRPSENITGTITNRYSLVMSIEEDYELYKRK